MKKLSIILAILLFLSIMGDTITTHICMTKYANYLEEANPISRYLMENNVYFLFKSVVMLISVGGLLVIPKTSKPFQIALIVVSIACICLMFYTTWNNIDNVIKVEHIIKK